MALHVFGSKKFEVYADNVSICTESEFPPPPYDQEKNGSGLSNGKSAEAEPLHSAYEVPDGGWGWVVMIGSFMVQFLTGCVVYVQGIFYPEFLKTFGQSEVATSWVCSMQTCIWLTGSIIGGPLIEVMGCKRLCMLGTLLIFLGELLSAFAPYLFVLYFTYGVLCGIGLSFIFFPSIVIVQRYFDKKRALAHSVANSGVSFGYFAMPPILQLMLDKYSWRGALMLIAAIMLHVILIAFLYRPLPRHQSLVDKKGFGNVLTDSINSIASLGKHKSKICEFLGSLCDFSLWKNPILFFDVLGYSLFNFGFIVPPMFLPSKARLSGVSDPLPALLISIMGVSDLLGRYVAGFFGVCLSERRIVMYFTAMMICGGATSIFSSMETYWMLAIYAGLFGLSTGVSRAINSVVTTDLMGVTNLPKAYGFKLFFSGLAVLASGPLAASVYKASGSYNTPFLVVGLIQVLAGFVVFILHLLRQYHCLK